MNKQEAKQKELRFYNGSACKRCGGVKRYVSSSDCVSCRKRSNSLNKDKIYSAHKKWREKNPVKARKANERWRKNNPLSFGASVAVANQKFKQCTPKWVTEDDRKLIKAIYFLCKFKSKITGIIYQVDHVIPIKGKNVCGLHVPSNLQIITEFENKSKWNRF